jgi:glutamyl-Q tRNA(Asp) synthetase
VIRTRFAPSPTGRLHLGHAFAAWFARDAALRAGGEFLLRIEDLDQTRSRIEYEEGIFEDLKWLGFEWTGPVIRQSKRSDAHREALAKLIASGLVYPCFCTRKEILAEIAAAGGAPHGPNGPIYPGTCRLITRDDAKARMSAGEDHALRLNVEEATREVGAMRWEDVEAGLIVADPKCFGDIVLARKDAPAAYHLAVTVDDADAGVTLVTRGNDLFLATDVQILLQKLLELPQPIYHHHKLMLGPDGRRLAKRDQSETIKALREEGVSPEEVLNRCRI